MTSGTLTRKKPLTRSARLERHVRIKPISRKRQRELAARKKCREAVYRRDEGECKYQIKGVCVFEGQQVHEPLTRARGGSITDPNNADLVCHKCQAWVHAHPKEAEALGYLRSQFGNDQSSALARHSSGGDR